MKLRYKILNTVVVLLIVTVLSLMLVLSHSSACGSSPNLTDSQESMKAIVHHCYSGPEVLALEEIEKPVVKDDEVLVKVVNAGVNPLDWHYLRGSPYIARAMMGIGSPNAIRLGVDFSGVVESVGDDVSNFKVGDEVFGGANGAYAEYLVLKEGKAIVKKPSNVSFEQAAAIPIAAITALQALRDEGHLKAGQRVLINGASGGVGTYAVQIAKLIGAEVSGVCSTRNVEMVKSLGADHVFDYKKVDFIESGEQFDLVLDNVGNRSLLEYTKILKPDGILVSVGGAKGDWIGPVQNIVVAQAIAPFVDQKMIFFIAQMKGEDLVTLAQFMESGKLKSVIDRRFPLENVADAIRYSETGRARGKIIIEM